MPEIYLVRRWGSHDAGQTVDVDDTMAAWLIGTCHGENPDKRGTASAGALAPGTDGADLRAGGDVSRGGGMKVVRGSRNDGEVRDNGEANYANRAARVPGAPKPVGDVSHVAEENLGQEHKENPGATLLASGKTLSQEQAERQRELDEQDKAAKQGESKDAKSGSAPAASGKSPAAEKQGPAKK